MSNTITAVYKKENNEQAIRILGDNFIKNNFSNCKLIYKDEEYELAPQIPVKDEPNNSNIEIKIVIIKPITDLSFMFADCKCLTYLPDICNLDTSKITKMNAVFLKCVSLNYLSDISKWDTSQVTEMEALFAVCSSLVTLPDISKWNISKYNVWCLLFTKKITRFIKMEYF